MKKVWIIGSIVVVGLFGTGYLLYRNAKASQIELPKFSCPVCKIPFDSEVLLKEHMLQFHSESGVLIPKMGMLVIKSVPTGANLTFKAGYMKEAQNIGITPFNNSMTPGIYKITIKMDGYKDFEQVVTVIDGKTTEINHIL